VISLQHAIWKVWACGHKHKTPSSYEFNCSAFHTAVWLIIIIIIIIKSRTLGTETYKNNAQHKQRAENANSACS